MSVPIEKIIARAEDTLSDATFTFENERFEVCVNRAYYAVFYCITALLEAKQVYAKTHQGSHNKFNELYLKTALMPQTLNDSLDTVFSLRQAGDYDFRIEITELEAQAAIYHARIFLAATRAYFEAER